MLDPALLKALIPWLLAAIALYMAASPRFGHEDSTPRLQQTVFYPLFGLVIGFYDGFLGPGTGSFWAMAFMVFLGYSLLKATAFTKVMNFTSNISALMIFLAAGQVQVPEGLVMGAGQFFGARTGARLATRRGTV